MRIATWNVERPKSDHGQRSKAILSKLREIDADIWILTETHDTIIPADDFHALSTDPVLQPPVHHAEGEHRTTIWSRWPFVEQIQTSVPNRTVCGRVDTPLGKLLLFGTIIPYHRAECPPYGNARQWEAHYAAIATQGAEWQRLRGEYRDHQLCVAGDFNQNRDGGRWYGTRWGRKLLTLALQESQLQCLTEVDFIASGRLPDDGQPLANGKRLSRRCIDHICLSDHWARQVTRVDAWSNNSDLGLRMSDHHGLYVDLSDR